MYEPAQHDEITGIVNFVEQQLDAIRAAAVGLTDEQARSTPTRSALSIGGLLKHVTYGMRGAVDRLSAPNVGVRELDEAAFAAYQGSFALTADESAADALDAFDAARNAYVAAIAATDPASTLTEPPQPWFGIFDARPANARYYLVHQIEEMARHAGHADIIREQIDGMAVPAIVMSLAGAPANDFFQPYVPAPGTLGA
ncbi:MAG: DUF664 domain-containing protein [Acidimicrobiia bacterium]